MVGEKMKNYRFTDEEIELIEIAVLDEIIKAKIRLEEGIENEYYLKIKNEYKDLLNTIKASKRYAKTIDKQH